MDAELVHEAVNLIWKQRYLETVPLSHVQGVLEAIEQIEKGQLIDISGGFGSEDGEGEVETEVTQPQSLNETRNQVSGNIETGEEK